MTGSEAGKLKDAFVGKVFLRHAPGHTLNQHYLDNIFPMNADLTEVKDEGFMAAEIDRMRLTRDGIVVPLDPDNIGNEALDERDRIRVRDVSRLWEYCNGNVPCD